MKLAWKASGGLLLCGLVCRNSSLVRKIYQSVLYYLRVHVDILIWLFLHNDCALFDDYVYLMRWFLLSLQQDTMSAAAESTL